MKNFTKLMTVILIVTMSVAGVLPVANATKEANASSYINSESVAQSNYISLGSYYISQANVKAMAQTMRASTGGTSMIIEALVGLVGGPSATAVMLATALSANAQSKTEVLYAADHNMRLHVVIKDQPVHTSYSTVVEFIAVY